MEKDFDFKEIGKSTPYMTPEHFFDDMQKKITDRVMKEKANNRKIKIAVMTILAMAAMSIGLIFIPTKRGMQHDSTAQWAKTNFKKQVVSIKKDTNISATKTMNTEFHSVMDRCVELQKPLKATNTASVQTTDKVADDNEWIEQLSDDDLSSLTALAENDEFLN